jgi:predicted GH43/DUF377 family glycosyl hydrolase
MQPKKSSQGQVRFPLVLERFHGNPVIKPNLSNRRETKAVFNPAVIHESGKVNILYCAIGGTDNSLIGYASSLDVRNISERFDQSGYVPREPLKSVNTHPCHDKLILSQYESGRDGTGGCEDPGLTGIEDRVYLTYVAYHKNNPPRIALSSIGIVDLLQNRWNWKSPVSKSLPKVVDNNVFVLPEMFSGIYVIFYRLFPYILIKNVKRAIQSLCPECKAKMVIFS